jgi:N-acetylglutamate synthase-like GNAT family acetyltransferase
MVDIRKLSENDAKIAQQLYILFQEDDGVLHPTCPPLLHTSNMLLRQDFHVFVALNNRKVIGGCTAYEIPMYKENVRKMFLYEIAVHHDYRRQKIGTKLIE